MRLLSILLIASLITPASKPSPALAGIAHVAFRVTNVAKSRDFYQKLGFEQSFEFNDPGKPPVSYMKVNDRQFIELYQRADDSQPLGLMHVCYEAADIEAVQRDYVQRDVKAPEPKKARAGNMLFTIRDPENQVVEFTQYMPGSLHFEDRGKHLGAARGSMHMQRIAFPVQDVAAERAFYAEKLGFEDSAGQGIVRLRVPRSENEEIQLDRTDSASKARISFEISNVPKTAEYLRSQGLTPQRNGEAISLTDPDGVFVIFNPGQYRRR